MICALKLYLGKLIENQLSIFEIVDPLAGQLKQAILSLDLNTMTPIECMLKIRELKNLLES